MGDERLISYGIVASQQHNALGGRGAEGKGEAEHSSVSFPPAPAGHGPMSDQKEGNGHAAPSSSSGQQSQQQQQQQQGEQQNTKGRPKPPGPPLPPLVIIIIWIGLSTSTIFFNRHILVDLHFPYPTTLTTMHLAFQTLATRLLKRYTSLIDGKPKGADGSSPSAGGGGGGAKYARLPTADDRAGSGAPAQGNAKADAGETMDWNTWARLIVPPAALFSASLVLSNWTYLLLPTSFIHIFRSFSPVVFLAAAFLFGTKAFSWKPVIIVGVISVGVAIASFSETHFSKFGLAVQLLAMFVEATRVTLIQILLQGYNMSPLMSLYLFAPICLGLNILVIPILEGTEAFKRLADVGFVTLFANAALTFALNLSSVYLISISAIVLSLSKILKDSMTVMGAALLLGDHIAYQQVFGYSIAIAGMIWYRTA